MEMHMHDVCHTKLSVKPQRLSAVLFYNTHPDMIKDEMALHGGCPVLEGRHSTLSLCLVSAHTDTRAHANRLLYLL